MEASNKGKDILLIVTDKENLIREIADILKDEYNIITALTVPEALSAITLKMPHIFIVDIDLPVMGGLELLKKIREGIKTRLIPFLIMSPENQKEEKIEALELGADDYINYPIDPEEMKAIVKMRLNKFREFYLLSVTDELTRLYNRKEFINKFNEEISHFPEEIMSLAIIDIDHFKGVNDIYGHVTGDMVLMRLAELMQERSCNNFFPARFGGEEFVILMPGLNMNSGKALIEDLLNEFSSIRFNTREKEFKVTFSAGISEYPLFAGNMSEMLSRADQALYAAKEDGRNRVYIFSKTMIRNDKFWQYMTSRKTVFINNQFQDTTTRIPYLPHVLEQIYNLAYEVKSIGLLLINTSFVEKAREQMNYKNINYDIENITLIIQRAGELIFPSDMYLALSDFFRNQFILLFPSIVDFSVNITEFNNICRDISLSIRESLQNLNIDISYNSGVVFIDSENPKKIYEDINRIRSRKILITKNSVKFESLAKILKENHDPGFVKKLFSIKYYYNTLSKEKEFQYLALKNFKYNDIFQVFINDTITRESELRQIGEIIAGPEIKKDIPLLVPYILGFPPVRFTEILIESTGDQKIILLFNEHELEDLSKEISSIESILPDRMNIGIDNCGINKDILNFLSIHDFKVLIFSDNILRNINFFRDRINIVNGLKLFLDQVGITAMAKNISHDEEFDILMDLSFKCMSGRFPESIFDSYYSSVIPKL